MGDMVGNIALTLKSMWANWNIWQRGGEQGDVEINDDKTQVTLTLTPNEFTDVGVWLDLDGDETEGDGIYNMEMLFNLSPDSVNSVKWFEIYLIDQNPNDIVDVGTYFDSGSVSDMIFTLEGKNVRSGLNVLDFNFLYTGGSKKYLLIKYGSYDELAVNGSPTTLINYHLERIGDSP